MHKPGPYVNVINTLRVSFINFTSKAGFWNYQHKEERSVPNIWKFNLKIMVALGSMWFSNLRQKLWILILTACHEKSSLYLFLLKTVTIKHCKQCYQLENDLLTMQLGCISTLLKDHWFEPFWHLIGMLESTEV